MKRIRVFCLTADIDEGMEKLTQELRNEGIPDSHVIYTGNAQNVFYAYIREDDELKLYENMKIQVNRANKILHNAAMRFSCGRSVDPGGVIAQEINEYVADFM